MLIHPYLMGGHLVSNHPGFCVKTHRIVCNMDPRKCHPRVHFQRDTMKGNIHDYLHTAFWHTEKCSRSYTYLLYTQEDIVQNIRCKLFFL